MVKIGRRNFKTAIAIFICSMTYVVLSLINEDFASGWYTPFFASLAAAYSVQSDRETSVIHAKNRSIASLFGGLYAMILVMIIEALFLNTLSDITYNIVKFSIISFMTVFLIIMTVKTKNHSATFVAILTYLNVTLNARTDIPVYQFALNRIICTIYGVNVALLVNMFRLPIKRKTDRMYLISIDDATMYTKNKLVGYPLYKLNEMIYSNYTLILYSHRTPDALRSSVGNLKINKPSLVLNGSALYDYSTCKYLHIINMKSDTVNRIKDIFKVNNISYFTGVIDYNLLHIYKAECVCEVEEDYLFSKQNAAYCSVIHSEYEKNDNVVYYMILEKDDRVKQIHKILRNSDIWDDITSYKYDYLGMDGYSLLKIYSSDVDKLEGMNMLINNYKLDNCLIVCSDKDRKLKKNNASKITFSSPKELDLVYKKMTSVKNEDII